jgi:hypothetical protein
LLHSSPAMGFGVDGVFRNGAPRPTKMGTIVSRWRYDGGACCAPQLVMLRQPTILYYVSRAPSRSRRWR